MLRYLYFLSMLFIVTVTSPQIRIIKNSPIYSGLYILRIMILFFILTFSYKAGRMYRISLYSIFNPDK